MYASVLGQRFERSTLNQCRDSGQNVAVKANTAKIVTTKKPSIEIAKGSLLQHAHVLQIPVILAVIQAVADYEGVGDLEADVVYLHGALASLGAVEKRGDSH